MPLSLSLKELNRKQVEKIYEMKDDSTDYIYIVDNYLYNLS